MAEAIQRLENGLAFVQDELVPELAIGLVTLADARTARMSELLDLLDRDARDVVLLGFSWRMVLPMGSGSMAWEDARMPMHDRERLKMPQVVRLLVKQACSSGSWQPDRVLNRTSPLLDDDAGRMEQLCSTILQYAPGQVISANELRAAFRETGIQRPMDTLIAHWKGAGVISPRLSSLSSVSAHRSPLYELNPSVFLAVSSHDVEKGHP